MEQAEQNNYKIGLWLHMDLDTLLKRLGIEQLIYPFKENESGVLTYHLYYYDGRIVKISGIEEIENNKDMKMIWDFCHMGLEK